MRDLATHYQKLCDTLYRYHELWSANPFYERIPAWELSHPHIAHFLRALSDDTLQQLENGVFPRHSPPELVTLNAELAALTQISALPPQARTQPTAHGLHWHTPGRKWEQINAFVDCLNIPSQAQQLVDWCAGKGHLGRLAALSSGLTCHCVEINATLCQEGAQLAQQWGAALHFECCDALAVHNLPAHAFACALHACGPLHIALIELACREALTGLALAPCCYNRAHAYRPLSQAAQQHRLNIDEEAAKLCLRETVTSSPRIANRRERETAWRLGFDLLHRDLSGHDQYRPIAAVPTAWLSADFVHFATQVAARIQLPLPANIARYEALGQARAQEVRRLGWLRNQFRRPIELALALDRAIRLQEGGYEVQLGTFCDYALTPRNLMIQARRLQ